MSQLLSGNVVYGGPVSCTETQAYRSLGHFVLEKLKSFGDRVMLINGLTGVKYTSKQMYDFVVRCAYIFEHLGVKSGDVIGLSCENRVEFAIVLYAAFAVNVTVAPLNVTYTERETHEAINLSRPKIIFASDISIERVAKVAEGNSFVRKLIVFGSTVTTSNTDAFDELMEDVSIPSIPFYRPTAANKREDVALIMCSSGTTGVPKGVQLTQCNILTTLDGENEPPVIPIFDVPILPVTPWFHCFGCLTMISAAVSGGVLIYLPKFDPTHFLGSVEKYRVRIVYLVPPLMVFLGKHPLVEKYDLSSLRVLYCGAAPLSKETEELVLKRIRLPIIRQGYGLSESTLILTIQTDENCKPGSVGALKKGLYAKVVDPDSGKMLGPNQRGELCFKGDRIMKGYVGDSKSTQNMIQDGWLHTGDIGYFDDDFEFFIVDRIKELIKYKGFQVPPAEIESLLLMHPKVKDVAVIGKPDEAAGELPMAFIVKQANVKLNADEIVKFVRDRASPAKKLRGGVVFIDEIPKNPSGKILRRVLRDMLKDQKSKL